jgi:hypothetical protein
MRLVPRQLQRAGMTGTVPYYGGRLSPSQAYAVSHQPAVSGAPASRNEADTAGYLTATLATLEQLLDDGVLTADEYQELRQRVLA